MKRIVTLVLISLVATLFGCKDATAPKSEIRVESASEAARNDDRAIAVRLAEQKAAADEAYARERVRELRQRSVGALLAISIRWDQTLDEANRTFRSEIAAVIRKLQTIKSDTESVEVDDCTSGARATLASSMDTTIEGMNTFLKETGTGAEPSALKLQSGSDILYAAKREINACALK